MSRVKLANIKSLTLYKDELTNSRRTSPIPQLVCAGKPCKLYQPEVIHCKNIGGSGLDVDWKCEADLPESLRFGKVMVSCEGWSKSGDPYVLSDSCSLEYRLVEVPKSLRNPNIESYHDPIPKQSMDIPSLIFTVVWVGLLLLICYSFLKSCLQRTEAPVTGTRRNNRPGGTPGPGGSFPGHFDDHLGGDAPPPYSKDVPRNDGAWRPGFWTGAVVGGLADRYLFRNQNAREDARDRSRRQWDWERTRQSAPVFGGGRAWASNSDDRGEGSSNLGSMRRSSGFGGSSSR